jgi:hypothetical protein
MTDSRVFGGSFKKGIAMASRLLRASIALTLLAGSSAPLAAASVITHVHAPALIRLDYTRPGGLPGSPRDIAAAREIESNGLVGTSKVHHKRQLRIR